MQRSREAALSSLANQDRKQREIDAKLRKQQEEEQLLAKRRALVKSVQAGRQESIKKGNARRQALHDKQKVMSFIARRGSVDLGYLEKDSRGVYKNPAEALVEIADITRVLLKPLLNLYNPQNPLIALSNALQRTSQRSCTLRRWHHRREGCPNSNRHSSNPTGKRSRN